MLIDTDNKECTVPIPSASPECGIRPIAIKILDSRIQTQFPLPNYATPQSAGLDLQACIDAPLVISPNQAAVLISTGIALHIADPQLAAMILPRSGLAHHYGLVLGNAIGLIDADYQGPLMISCWNRGLVSYTVQPGQRIAQLVFVPIVRVQWKVVEQFADTKRGQNGFGHSGS